MKRTFRAFSVFAICLSAMQSSFAAGPQAQLVYPAAVLPFQDRGDEAKGLGAKVSDVVFASLAADSELNLVDRADLTKTLEEQEISLSGLVQPDQAVQVGRLTGAKILITGSVLQLDRKLYLVAKIIGTETGRVAGASVKGEASEDLASLADKLAESVRQAVKDKAKDLIAKPVAKQDRIEAIKKALGESPRPKLWIEVQERHVGQQTIDPAVETELTLLCRNVGFEVIDHKQGSRQQADVLISGEAFSEFATRRNNLISAKARVEIKAVNRADGMVIAADRQTEVAVDLAEQIAGKTALQQGGAAIAERILPKLVEKPNKSDKPAAAQKN